MWCCGCSVALSQSGRSSEVTCLCPASCPPSPLLRCSLGNPPPPPLFTSWDGEPFFPGCRVLARNQGDGLYLLGSVVHKTQSCRGLWVVEFDPPACCRELVCSLDMVLLDRTGLPCVRPGDTVLCPVGPETQRYRPGLGPETQRYRPGLGPESQRFGPGRVVSASHRDAGVVCVRVLLWDSSVSLAPLSSLCLLSQSHFYRITRELLRGKTYGCCQSPLCYHDDRITCQSHCLHGNHSIHQSPPCFCCCCLSNQTRTNSGLTRTDPGLTRTKPGLTRTKPGLRTNSGFPDVDRTNSGFREEQEEQEEQEEVRTDEDRPGSSSESLFESEDLRARKQRPPWRYWRRTGPEPHYRKPGGAVSRRPSQFSFVSFPSPQSSSSPNHSSVFQPLTSHTRGGGGVFKFRPHPPANQRPGSAANHRALSPANHRPRSVV